MRRALILAFVLVCPVNAWVVGEGETLLDDDFDPDRFTFVRVIYDSSGGLGESWYRFEGRDWQRWETDYPRGGLNLLYRLTELTSLEVNPQPLVLRLTDPKLANFPLIFMSDVGWQVLSPAEQRALKVYLENGGFLWVDDFWGQAEWDNLERNTRSALPGWRWIDIKPDHAILRTVYRMQECPQIPAKNFYVESGLTYDPHWVHRRPNGGAADLAQVHFRGLYDLQGRLVGVATHNTDIADGWEREGEDREFFDRFSVKAYALAVNVITYAMSH